MVAAAVAFVIVMLILLGILWLLWRLTAALCNTVAWRLSGEAGGLWAKGFRSKGSRYRRTADIERIIGYIALAVRRGYPISSTLKSAAPGEPPRVGIALHEIAEAIERGLGVAQALRAASLYMPDVFIAMIAEGERAGRLSDALTEIEELLADRLFIGPEQNHPAYALAVLTLLVSAQIVAGSLVWLIPKYRDIFNDFDAALPAPTVFLINFSRELLFVGPIALLMVAALLLTAAFGLGRRWDGRPRLMARLVGALRWRLPGVHAIDYGLGMSVAIRQLRLHLMSGRPLSELHDLSRVVRPTNHLGGCLSQFVAQIHQGVVPSRAAAGAGLGEVFVAALRAIERGEDPAPALEYAGNYYQAVGARWINWASALAAPLVTLVTAMLVGGIVYSLFLPLIALIDQVTRSIEWA